METITFNPFRLAKDGTIIVASYMYWRKPLLLHRQGIPVRIITTVDLEIKYDGLIYNSHGDFLYWPNFERFEDIPKYVSCFDCEGTPAFAHFTNQRVKEAADFFKSRKYNNKPLTIDVIKLYFKEMVEKTSDVIIWENVRKKVV